MTTSINRARVIAIIPGYPSAAEVARILRNHAPDAIFLNFQRPEFALLVMQALEAEVQGLPVVAFDALANARNYAELERTFVESVTALAEAVDRRDPYTGGHVRRVVTYSLLLGEELGLPPDELETLRLGTTLHDIGKIGVPDAILRKPGPLDEAERRLMEKHTIIGARILEGSLSDVLRVGSEIALTHHERWDGTGYPHRLVGPAIPLHGRICAVSDVFDALTTDRPYRAAIPVDTVFTMLEAERGRQFDPEVLDAFLADRDEVVAIRQELMTHQGVWDHAPIAGAA